MNASAAAPAAAESPCLARLRLCTRVLGRALVERILATQPAVRRFLPPAEDARGLTLTEVCSLCSPCSQLLSRLHLTTPRTHGNDDDDDDDRRLCGRWRTLRCSGCTR